MIKITVDNIYSRIIGHLPDEVHEELNKVLSYRIKDAHFTKLYKQKKWDGRIKLYHKSKGQYFYTGLFSLAREVLKDCGIKYTVEDKRIRPPQNLPHLKFTPIEEYSEREYQTITLNRSMDFTRGILCICTGSGKTVNVARIIGEIKTGPFMFYVLTKDLMLQAHKVLTKYLNEPIGMIGDSQCDIKNINVCTIQTAVRCVNHNNSKLNVKKYKFDDEDVWNEKQLKSLEKIEAVCNVIENARGIYFDEMHHASSQTAKDVLRASKQAYWRFGGSATPVREAGDTIMLQALFGSKIVDINASYLIKLGYLLKPHIYFVPIEHSCPFNSYAKIYKHCIVDNPDFNAHVAKTANYLVSNGLTTLILVSQFAQGEFIKSLIPNCEFVTSKMTTKKRDECISNLRDKKNMAMIATSLADEGLDIPTLDSVILAGGGASSTRVNQRIGRTLRTSQEQQDSLKNKSIVISYNHDAKYLREHTKKVKKILKKESEFKVMDSKGQDFVLDEIGELLNLECQVDTLF